MTTTHTPGPWAYIKPDGVTVRHPQVYSDTGPICHATWLGDGRLKELEANAALIAAAPDLLEALNQMLTLVVLAIPFDGPQQRKARAAIDKAAGVAT